MDYCLDSGDGTASIWTGAFDIDVDGDGELDGVRLDFDGDGVFDDALADFDDDGLADHAALDLDDDGLPESRYTDNGSGTWMVGAGISEWGAASGGALRWFGLDGVEHASGADVDGDGDADRLFDMNRDGLADRVLLANPGGRFAEGYVDVDGDGGWDVALSDADGDGAADGAARI